LDLIAALDVAVKRNVRVFWQRAQTVVESVTLHGSVMCNVIYMYIQLETWFSVVVIVVVCSTIYANINVVKLPKESICAYWWLRAIRELFTLSFGWNR
jgi:hypothetical protein